MEQTASPCLVCNQPATLRCSSCKTAPYCCKDHQKEDWKTHKNGCRSWEVQVSKKFGKHIVAAKDISKGSIILDVLPIVIAPTVYPSKITKDSKLETTPCVGCYRLVSKTNPPARCLQCGWPTCGTQCAGLNSEKGHLVECPILQLSFTHPKIAFNESYKDYAVMPLRCLLLQKCDPKKWKQLLQMVADYEQRGDIRTVDIDKIASYLYSIYICGLQEFKVKNNQNIECSQKLIQKICRVMDEYAVEEIHRLTDTGALALYPTTYLLAHSCLPNTYQIFEDDPTLHRIRIFAARDIKKGESITKMYVTDPLSATTMRQLNVQRKKFYSCECERCKDPTELGTYISALKCEKGCVGYLLPVNPLHAETTWKCNLCHLEKDSVSAFFLPAVFHFEIGNIQDKIPSVSELETLLEKCLKLLHSNHCYVYAVKIILIHEIGSQEGYLHQQLTDEQLQRKMKLCRDLIDINNKIDPHACCMAQNHLISLHELHLAQFEFLQRKWADRSHEKLPGPLKEMLKECRTSLESCKDLLKREPIGSITRYRLMNAQLLKSTNHFDKWVKDFLINV